MKILNGRLEHLAAPGTTIAYVCLTKYLMSVAASAHVNTNKIYVLYCLTKNSWKFIAAAASFDLKPVYWVYCIFIDLRPLESCRDC